MLLNYYYKGPVKSIVNIIDAAIKLIVFLKGLSH
jgi:hypothetical protein